MSRSLFRSAFATLALGATALGAQATFNITINYTGLTATEQSYFASAESFWESVITGYKGGVNLTGLTIAASGAPMDGVGGVLGSAGPTAITLQGGIDYTTTGVMSFDSADITNMIANGSFSSVIQHEMGHVIGFGTLWTLNGLYVDGSGQYTGANALATYRTEFNQPAATFVPVELGGGSGTANGHWNEVDGGGGNTGIVDSLNRDMKNELMTGWLNSPTFVSLTTINSFKDLGYVVSAVPEPGVMAMWLLGLPVVWRLSAKRRRDA
jgi:hypothetical protein